MIEIMRMIILMMIITIVITITIMMKMIKIIPIIAVVIIAYSPFHSVNFSTGSTTVTLNGSNWIECQPRLNEK